MDVFELAAKISLDSSEYESGLQGASESTHSFGEGIGGKLGAAAKVGAAAVAAVGTAIVAAGGAMVAATKQVAEYGDAIDKNSQKMGVSAQFYQEWSQVLQHSGTSMESMKNTMKTLANAAADGSSSTAAAFQKLGLSMQEVSSMSQEDLFATTISRLQEMESSTERTAIATDLLGRGAMELGALLNTSAEDTERMIQRAHELGGVMSDEAVKASARFQDSLQDMQFAIQGVKNGMAEDLLPAVSTVMDGIANVISGFDVSGGLQQIKQGVSEVVEVVTSKLPQAIETIGQIGAVLGGAILDNLPAIGEAAISVIQTLGDGIATALPAVLDQIPEMIVGIADFIGENLPALMETGVQIVLALIEGLAQAIPELISYAPQIIMSLAEGIIGAAGTLISAAPAIIESLVSGIVSAAGALVTAGLTMINNVGAGIASGVGNVVSACAGVIAAAVSTVAGAVGQFVSGGVAWIGGVASGVLSAIGGVLGAVQNVINSAIGTVLGAIGQFTSGGVAWITGIASGISGAVGQAITAITGIGQSALSAIQGMVGQFATVGSSIVQGIANGIKNGVSSVISAAVSVATSALNAAKSALGINSPSKVFRDVVGLSVGEGIAVGIDRSYSYVDDAIGRMARKSVDSASSIGSRINSAIGSVEFAASGLGLSSAGLINTVAGTAESSGGVFNINLVTADGNQMAQWIFDPLKDHAAAKGTPILSV